MATINDLAWNRISTTCCKASLPYCDIHRYDFEGNRYDVFSTIGKDFSAGLDERRLLVVIEKYYQNWIKKYPIIKIETNAKISR